MLFIKPSPIVTTISKNEHGCDEYITLLCVFRIFKSLQNPQITRKLDCADDIKEHAIEAFKDEYLLDFLTTDDVGSERRMEKGIINKLKRFMMSLGGEFTFMGSQYRLIVGGDEFFIDLLFFHRTLRCMVVFELKTDKFRPEYVGKMNFYLSALDAIVKHPEENPSIGIVLCKEKNSTVVEFAFQDTKKPMGVATFRHGNELPEHARKYLPTPEELTDVLSS